VSRRDTPSADVPREALRAERTAADPWLEALEALALAA
jgi:hypothetical protein